MDEGPGPSKRIRFTDVNYEEVATQWLNEVAADSDEDNVCEDVFEISEHETDSEEDCDESDGDRPVDSEEEQNKDEALQGNSKSSKSFYGKNRFKWSSESLMSRSRTPKHNIILRVPTLRALAACLGHKANPVAVWNLLFSDDMLQSILQWTNDRIQNQRQKFTDSSRTEIQDMDLVELKAFIGLLFYTAAFVSNHENINRIFATDGTGREIFRCVMSKQRFAFLLACIRFDNSIDRNARLEDNPIAPISDIFDKFVSNSQAMYSLGANVTIDEMLVSFRGRWKYKVYMPNKPCKYGIKIVCMTDARSHYFYNGYVYTGKDSDGFGLNAELKKFLKPTQSVLRLVKPIENTNRNVTADNWFSSLEVVQQLKNRGLTYVGTLKKSKREIPPEFLPKKNRKVGKDGTLFGFTKDVTLVSYVPKINKSVILVSSMHHSKSFDDDTQKPEIIMYYNFTKGGVDAIDEKCSKHSTSRRTRRWTMAIFFRLLDLSGVNAHVLHQAYKGNPVLEKADFIKLLADELVKPHLERRAANMKIPRELRFSIRRILNIPEEPQEPENRNMDKLEKRKTCYTCPSRIKRKTYHLCFMCKKPICLECASKLCQTCKCKV